MTLFAICWSLLFVGLVMYCPTISTSRLFNPVLLPWFLRSLVLKSVSLSTHTSTVNVVDIVGLAWLDLSFKIFICCLQYSQLCGIRIAFSRVSPSPLLMSFSLSFFYCLQQIRCSRIISSTVPSWYLYSLIFNFILVTNYSMVSSPCCS